MARTQHIENAGAAMDGHKERVGKRSRFRDFVTQIVGK
jgi:hypothetical protein